MYACSIISGVSILGAPDRARGERRSQGRGRHTYINNRMAAILI